jgi:hypothetical protein
MTFRIAIAGLLGAIAMFVWSTIAHVALPLGQAGFSQLPNEAAVLSAMQASAGAKDGLYFFPWVDMKSPDAMQKSAALMKANPSGLLLYHPPGRSDDMTVPLILEFAKQLVIALIGAWLVSVATVGSFAGRVMVASSVGVAMALTTNFSYLIWYGFPLDFTLAAMVTEFGEMFFAGIVMAWWLGRGAKA